MKANYLKNMALWFAMATMVSSTAVFAHHSHSHSSSELGVEKHCRSTIKLQVLTPALEAALDQILAAINAAAITEATAVNLSPGTFTVTIDAFGLITVTGPESILPTLAAANNQIVDGAIRLINALQSQPCPRGLNSGLLTQLQNDLIAFGVAGEQYSAAQAAVLAGVAISTTPYFDAWIALAAAIANDLNLLLGAPDHFQPILNDLVTSLAQSVQARYGVLSPSALFPGETQAQAAVRYSGVAFSDAGSLARHIAKKFVKYCCHH